MDTILFRSEKLCRTYSRTPMHNWEDMLKEAILTVNARHSFNIIASTLNSIAWLMIFCDPLDSAVTFISAFIVLYKYLFLITLEYNWNTTNI